MRKSRLRRSTGGPTRRSQQFVQCDTRGEVVSAPLLLATPIWISVSFGMGLPGHIWFVGIDRAELSDSSL